MLLMWYVFCIVLLFRRTVKWCNLYSNDSSILLIGNLSLKSNSTLCRHEHALVPFSNIVLLERLFVLYQIVLMKGKDNSSKVVDLLRRIYGILRRWLQNLTIFIYTKVVDLLRRIYGILRQWLQNLTIFIYTKISRYIKVKTKLDEGHCFTYIFYSMGRRHYI